MGFRGAFTTGTVLSVTVTAAWSSLAAVAAGPAPRLHLTRNLLSDSARLASAPTGNGLALFAAAAVIYTACFLVSGLRAMKAAAREAEDPHSEALVPEEAGWY